MRNTDTSARNEPPFNGLVAFEATARLASMSAAADELDLTQSAISQRVLKLEAHVGQRLFIRQGHGVRLTGVGELLMETATDTLQRLRAGFARIEPCRNKQSLLLACPSDFAHGWLLPRLEALRAAHGGLEVWLMSEHDVSAIDRIDVDLVVSRRPLHGPDIDCELLLEDRAIAVCGARVAEKLAGIAYLSQVLAADALASGRCVALPRVPATPRPPLWAMRSRLTPRTPMADRAFEWLRSAAKN
jgi:LysR family glycine cleavage system transcriptional activator